MTKTEILQDYKASLLTYKEAMELLIYSGYERWLVMEWIGQPNRPIPLHGIKAE